MIRAKEDAIVTKRPRVTKSLREAVTKVGRPKLHKSDADKQRAYRMRKRATA